MARYFRAEPGVVKVQRNGAAVMYNGCDSWPVRARHITYEMDAPELTEDEYESVLEGLRKAASRRRAGFVEVKDFDGPADMLGSEASKRAPQRGHLH